MNIDMTFHNIQEQQEQVDRGHVIRLHENNFIPLRSENQHRVSVQMFEEVKLEAYQTRNLQTNIYIETMTNVSMWLCRADEVDFNATIPIEGFIHPQKKGFVMLNVKNKRKNRIRLEAGDIVAYLILTPYLRV